MFRTPRNKLNILYNIIHSILNYKPMGPVSIFLLSINFLTAMEFFFLTTWPQHINKHEKNTLKPRNY